MKKKIVLFLLCCLVTGYAKGQTGNSRKPNIVFILVDDLGWHDVGFMGNEYHETPNIDHLADQGMVFTAAYANAPNCAPSRASLMSGQYAPRHGIYTVGSSARGKSGDRKLIPIQNTTVLNSSIITLSEVLQNAGYVTGMFGKWHLGDSTGTSPEGQGFDVNVGGNMSGHPESYFSPYHNEDMVDGAQGEYLTDRLTTDAIQFIERHKKDPFFLYLPFYAVHKPWQAKDSLVQKYKNKPSPYKKSDPAYAAMVENMDYNVGRLLDALKQRGLSKNTVVFFYSDNGPLFSVAMGPLRGSKGMLYEGGIRVPMIVRWPGKIEAGTVSNVPVIGIDLFPTIIAMTNTPKPEEKILDGVSLTPVLFQTGSLEREAIFWHFPAYLQASGAMDRTWRTTPVSAMRSGNWKLIEFFETGELELYNLAKDMSESNDLSEEKPKKTKELYIMLKKWRLKLNAPIPTILNPAFVPDS